MIIDTFQFFNEYDMLEGRLEYLYPVVDKFVITEANITHSGNDKPYRFVDNIERYKKYLDKIIYVPSFFDKNNYNFSREVNEQDFTHDAWSVEMQQRDKAMDIIKCFSDDSLVLINDIDEIPKRDTVNILRNNYIEGEFISVLMTLYRYNLSCLETHGWRGTTVVSVKTANQWGSLSSIRSNRGMAQRYIHNGGWHLTYWGDYRDIVYKYKSFAHQELNRDHLLAYEKIKEDIQKITNNPETYEPELIEYFGKYERKFF